jgi:hypothetical protein
VRRISALSKGIRMSFLADEPEFILRFRKRALALCPGRILPPTYKSCGKREYRTHRSPFSPDVQVSFGFSLTKLYPFFYPQMGKWPVRSCPKRWATCGPGAFPTVIMVISIQMTCQLLTIQTCLLSKRACQR